MWVCPKCREQIEEQFDTCWKCAAPVACGTDRPVSILVKAFLALCLAGMMVIGLMCWLISFLNWWPPRWIETKIQRSIIAERIETVGGWTALQRDCDKLVAKYKGSYLHWSRWDTNELPPAVGALKPMSVEFFPQPVPQVQDSGPKLGSSSSSEKMLPFLPNIPMEAKPVPPTSEVVRIRVFGVHSTGGHSTPFFGLEVHCGPGSDTHEPQQNIRGVRGYPERTYRKVSEGIYEVY